MGTVGFAQVYTYVPGSQEGKAKSAVGVVGGNTISYHLSLAPINVWFGIYSSSLWKKLVLVLDAFLSGLEDIHLVYFPKCCTLYSHKICFIFYFSVPDDLLGRKWESMEAW